MICVRLDGGLGNQLFQYAAGRSLSVIHNTDLLIDVSSLGVTRRNVTTRNFELCNFNHASRFATASESASVKWLINFPILTNFVGQWRIFSESQKNFDPNFFNLPDWTYLYGFWQNPSYFEHIASLLTVEFEHSTPLSASSLEVAKAILEAGADSVSVQDRKSVV